MVASAASAASRVSAATSATLSPTWRTNSAASTGQSAWMSGIRFRPGMSFAVRTALTPGRARARATSRRAIRAWAWGDRRTRPTSEPAKSRSSM